MKHKERELAEKIRPLRTFWINWITVIHIIPEKGILGEAVKAIKDTLEANGYNTKYLNTPKRKNRNAR